MSVTPTSDERDADGPMPPDDVENSLPPVVPEDEEPTRPNSLPPVVPEDEEPAPTSSLPPVVPDDEENSLPPVVPDDDDTAPTRSVPPEVPQDEEPEAADEPEPAPAGPTPPPEPADDDPVDDPVRAEPNEQSGWAVLGRALKPRSTRAQLVAGVLCAVLGFALVAQVRQSGEADLGGMRQGDLVRILDETTNRGDALARESADLARERDDLLSGSDRRQAALDALRRSAETQGILTGRLPAEGPGVVVTLTEPDGFIKPITMLNMLEEMRNAGAEAVQLNDQRVTASSAFTGTGGAVVLDGVELTAPYRWVAIGDPDIIAPALQIPGGAMAQVRNNGGRGTVERQELVEVDAIRVVPDPVFATPVPPQGD
ncbi:DUF881 domain-containing protein [Cellulomonas sp. Root137]|uniref:DUF881 domain-containing protein n=1 Tax=Cellulomonas sp. Root137 TaxID=1736459 RepID=UPI000AD6E49A|nr:DUF881 domain-containing protein [Cellulomonas sp. Root137]